MVQDTLPHMWVLLMLGVKGSYVLMECPAIHMAGATGVARSCSALPGM